MAIRGRGAVWWEGLGFETKHQFFDLLSVYLSGNQPLL